MLTFTLDSRKMSDAEFKDGGIEYIRKSCRKLRVYLQRKYGHQGIECIAVVELQKRAIAHLHILVEALGIPASKIQGLMLVKDQCLPRVKKSGIGRALFLVV
jgi:hypothetical protein